MIDYSLILALALSISQISNLRVAQTLVCGPEIEAN